MSNEELIARLLEQAVTPVPFPEYALRDAAAALEQANTTIAELRLDRDGWRAAAHVWAGHAADRDALIAEAVA